MSRKKLSIETIERWMKDDDWRVRSAAMNACSGRTDIPLETIERGLRDDDCDVRAAAMNACKSNGINVPVIRTFDPPEVVYKKCIGGVIVSAKIPSDAQVRGKNGEKCRSDKAIIIAIEGNIAGESVGISSYDKKTTYFVGDEVVIDNFDYSEKECSTGFHFFCTRYEAERYNT